MKLVPTSLICLLTFGGVAVALPVAGQNAFKDGNNPPPEITLNGLASIFDDQRALFKVRSSVNGYGEIKAYCLAVGQRDGGIELLSVDMVAGKIKVNNHGVIQTVALRHSPDLGTLAATGNHDRRNPSARQSSEMNADPRTPLPGSPIAEASGQSAGDGGDNAGFANQLANASPEIAPPANDAMPANNSAPVNDPGNSSPNARKGGYALVAARQFEQLRLQTAAAVYDGIADPLPLTPLTPPGTPMALIGPDRAWFPEDD